MIESRDANGWKVRIERPILNDCLYFYLIRFTLGFVDVMQPDGNIKRIKEGEAKSDDILPTFILGGLDSKSMLIALAEALETEGVKTPNDFKIQGLLEAKSAHLEDMRRLVFKAATDSRKGD